jgi:hypothetical protein
VREHPEEVSPLSREGKSFVGERPLYPDDYDPAFAFSSLLCPLSRGQTLRPAVSGEGEDNGFTTFPNGVRAG